MTATVKKPIRRPRSARRTVKPANAGTELRPFSIVNGKYVFWFEPAPEGGFSVSCQNFPGVNAEGDTFEEALTDAMKCVAFVEECLAEIAKEETGQHGTAMPDSRKVATRARGWK